MLRSLKQVFQQPIAKRHYAFGEYQCPPELGVGLMWLVVVGLSAIAQGSGLLVIKTSWGSGSGMLAILCFAMVCRDLLRVGESRWLVLVLGLCGVVGSLSLGLGLDALLRTPRNWALATLCAFAGGTAIGFLVRFGRSRFHVAVRSRLAEIGYRVDELRRALEEFKGDTGYYPAILAELIPKHLPSLPRFRWAIDGGFTYQRLEHSNSGSYVIGVNVIRGFQIWRFLFVPGIGEDYGAFWYQTVFEYAYERRRAK